MKLHPYKEFTIETSLTKNEVIKRLNSLERPKQKGFWNSLPDSTAYLRKPEKRFYEVVVKHSIFTIYIDFNLKGLGFITDFYRMMARLGSSPRVIGILFKNEKRTIINIGVKLPILFNLISTLLFIIGVIFCFSLIVLMGGAIIEKEWQVLLIAVISFLVLGFLIAIIKSISKYYLNNYYKDMLPFLTNLFEAQ